MALGGGVELLAQPFDLLVEELQRLAGAAGADLGVRGLDEVEVLVEHAGRGARRGRLEADAHDRRLAAPGVEPHVGARAHRLDDLVGAHARLLGAEHLEARARCRAGWRG